MDLAVYIAVLLGVILFSMTLHEVMHGYIAYRLGDDTAKLQGRLTLNPIHHIDPFMTILLPLFLAVTSYFSGGMVPIFGGAKPVPFNPARVKFDEWGAALVALAGPLTNLVIAFIFFGVASIAGVGTDGGLAAEIMRTMIVVNLGFFIFNMLPIPPLDGSRVLYALAPDFIRRGMELIEQYGIVLVFAIVLLASRQIGMLIGSGIEFFLMLFNSVFSIF